MTFRAQEHARAHLRNARNVRRTAKAWMARPRTVRRGPQIRVSDRQLVAILQVIELGQYEQCGLKSTFPVAAICTSSSSPSRVNATERPALRMTRATLPRPPLEGVGGADYPMGLSLAFQPPIRPEAK